MRVKLGDLLEEYSERNIDNAYRPVAVGKYGIRSREGIYSKELAKDYSKNKLIHKGTLTVGMGSKQIDIGILDKDATYSVSPAYHTYKIKIKNYKYLDYLMRANNFRMFSQYAKRGSRQGKSLDLKRWLSDELDVHSATEQDKIVNMLRRVETIIETKEKALENCDKLVKARFVEMFGKEKPTVPFGDVLIDNTKNGYKFDSKFYNSRGEIAIIDQGQSLICGRMNLQKNKMPWSNEAIIFGDHTEVFKYIDFPFYLGADGTKLLTPKRGWDARFLYYYLVVNYRKRLGYMRHFKYLKEMLFIKPGIDEQLEFKIICNQVDKSKFALQKSLEKTQLLFDSLMWEYFGQ